MVIAIQNQAERASQRLESSRAELIERIAHSAQEDGVVNPLDGVYLARQSRPLQKIYSVLEPSFCVIVQGKKQVMLGDSQYEYDESNYLITTLNLPRASHVREASPERPYLSFRLRLDRQLVGSVMIDSGYRQTTPQRAAGDARAIAVNPLDADLLEAVVRLIRLIDAPSEVPILMPMITREIIFRLLVGQQGTLLQHITNTDGYTSVIAQAVQRINQDFDKAIRMEELAKDLGMSVSGFHYHFKSVTAMSPLQFQKQLRLQEARRLMFSENLDATSAAYRVGYNDASHFNREYKSVFGTPPMRDVQHMRQLENVLVS